jgi:hypothetical protein
MGLSVIEIKYIFRDNLTVKCEFSDFCELKYNCNVIN